MEKITADEAKKLVQNSDVYKKQMLKEWAESNLSDIYKYIKNLSLTGINKYDFKRNFDKQYEYFGDNAQFFCNIISDDLKNNGFNVTASVTFEEYYKCDLIITW